MGVSIVRISNLHERCVRLIQKNYSSCFEISLEDANEKSIHRIYTELPLIEVYNYLSILSPNTVNTIN